jgi:hypothetical protein
MIGGAKMIPPSTRSMQFGRKILLVGWLRSIPAIKAGL